MMLPRGKSWLSLPILIAWIAIPFLLNTSFAQPPMLEVRLANGVDRGLPVHWSERDVLLLHQDGSLRFLKTPEVESHRILQEPFTPVSSMELKGDLQEEFGRDYEIHSAGDYLFVVPSGSSDTWAKSFLELHASFTRFCATRNLQTRRPEFPLITLLFRSQGELQRYAAREGTQIASGTLGYYSATTNRMALFVRDVPASHWFRTHTTVFHEATHQLAFNMGVHQRLSHTPLWLVEGLASLFESPGYIDPLAAQNEGKLNAARLQTWKKLAHNPNAMNQLVVAMVESDDAFESSPDEAYAVAWGLTYYLTERDASHYRSYLHQMASLKPNLPYPRAERARDFRKFLSPDIGLLVRNIDRYLGSLREP